jgi:hypothetical protein
VLAIVSRVATRYRRWLLGPSAWWTKALAWTGSAFIGLVLLGAVGVGGEEDGEQPDALGDPATSTAGAEAADPTKERPALLHSEHVVQEHARHLNRQDSKR